MDLPATCDIDIPSKLARRHFSLAVGEDSGRPATSTVRMALDQGRFSDGFACLKVR